MGALNLRHIKAGDPSWLSPSVKARLAKGGRLVRVARFSEAEKKALQKREPIPVSVHAERHRVVTVGPLPGLWRNVVTPYLVGVMDASFFSSVRTVVLCAAPQTGKSDGVHNCIAYAIDRDPGAVMYVYPDSTSGRENCQDRIQTMLETSPRLRGYLTGVDDDVANLRIRLQHMHIYIGWARSASRLANKPIRYMVFDETDKYPGVANKLEADPISLGEKRTRNFPYNKKIWKISSPTVEAGYIWQAFTKEAQFRYDYWVKCPLCDAEQLMKFDDIKWPDGERDPEVIFAEDLARYKCSHCNGMWNDRLRNKAVRAGRWCERESGMELTAHLQAKRPKKIGFHIPSWLSFFVGLSEVAADFLKGRKDKEALKDFMNGHKAEPWRDYTVVRQEDAILALRDDRKEGVVPGEGVVAGLLGTVDSQAKGFYYEVRAWGYGLAEESWSIRSGYVTSFEALAKVLWGSVYLDAEGNKYVVQFTVMDAMGGTKRQTAGVGTRTSEVYDFCRLNAGRIVPFKGEQRMNQPYGYSKIDCYPGTNTPIPGGLQLLRANVTYYKNKLSNKLETAPADPGAWHYHSELSNDHARQMTVEYADEQGLWQCPKGSANHMWDVSVYQLVAADVVGIKFWPKIEPVEQVKPKISTPSPGLRSRVSDYERPSWLNR